MMSMSLLTVLADSDAFMLLSSEIILPILPTSLAYLPLLVNAWYFLWKLTCCMRCRAACWKRVRLNTQESRQEEDESRQVEEEQTFEAYLDLDEVSSI